MRPFTLLWAAIACTAASVAEPQILKLWDGDAPGWKKPAYAEVQSRSSDGVLTLRNVVDPTLEIRLPPADKANGLAMIVIPGGGFTSLAYGKEGTRIAEWLNTRGIAAFVLKYRVAHTDDTPITDNQALWRIRHAALPLSVADGEQAMRLVRKHAARWGVKRIGVIGFSAGGWLTTTLATHADATLRPDVAVMLYPAAPPDITVPQGAPPLFVAMADNDRYGTSIGIRVYQAWHMAHIPAEIHIYAKGDHGFAMRRNDIPTDSWPDRLADWMSDMGFLPKAK